MAALTSSAAPCVKMTTSGALFFSSCWNVDLISSPECATSLGLVADAHEQMCSYVAVGSSKPTAAFAVGVHTCSQEHCLCGSLIAVVQAISLHSQFGWLCMKGREPFSETLTARFSTGAMEILWLRGATSFSGVGCRISPEGDSARASVSLSLFFLLSLSLSLSLGVELSKL